MSIILVFTKGRPRSGMLLSICRQWAAHCLAADLYPHLRWVPLQRNTADDPSRDQKRHLADVDVAEAQVAIWKKAASPLPTAARDERKEDCTDSHPPASQDCHHHTNDSGTPITRANTTAEDTPPPATPPSLQPSAVPTRRPASTPAGRKAGSGTKRRLIICERLRGSKGSSPPVPGDTTPCRAHGCFGTPSSGSAILVSPPPSQAS